MTLTTTEARYPIITSDKSVSAVYIQLFNGKVESAKELMNGITVDLDGHGAVVGVEIVIEPKIEEWP